MKKNVLVSISMTEMENGARNYLNMLTNNKTKELRREMIKFLKEGYWNDSEEYGYILEFINDFFCESQESRIEEECEKC